VGIDRPKEIVMSRGIFGTPIVPALNAVAAKLIDVPLLGNIVRRNTVMISYVGRRSGKTFTTPVSYRRIGDEIVIHVGLPDAKNWWRNFLDGGGPITLQLNGTNQTGHAVATRDDQGRVTVTVKLDDR
jgi:F420H(2)-dependent quinone reductase